MRGSHTLLAAQMPLVAGLLVPAVAGLFVIAGGLGCCSEPPIGS
jgi:hypothetical protein